MAHLILEHTKIETISAKNLEQKLLNKSEFILINVLDEKAFNNCHIKNSINIPYEKLIEITSSWNKDKEIIVYCSETSSDLSTQAYLLLKDIGFNHLFHYPGGIKEWVEKKLPIQGTCKLH